MALSTSRAKKYRVKGRFVWYFDGKLNRMRRAVNRPSKTERGTTRRSREGLEGLMVSHNEKAFGIDYHILKVAFHTDNFGGLLRGSGSLAKVRVCPPEVRALQLGSLPSSTASEGHLDRALENIINKEAANNRIFEFNDKFANLATRVQTFLWVAACLIGG